MEEKELRFGVRRYSTELKQLICKEHIEQGVGLNELKRKYHLSSHSLIHEWLRKFNYLPAKYRYERNVIEIGIEHYANAPVMKSNPSVLPPQTKDENAELAHLKRELLEAQMRADAFLRVIEIAEQDLKIPIRKKSNTK